MGSLAAWAGNPVVVSSGREGIHLREDVLQSSTAVEECGRMRW